MRGGWVGGMLCTMNEPFIPYEPADEAHVRREKTKARELRSSQWWKNQCGRGRCHYCKREISPKELTMDHVVPLARGGRTTRSNVVPCCKDCNTRKRSMLPVEWGGYLAELEGGET